MVVRWYNLVVILWLGKIRFEWRVVSFVFRLWFLALWFCLQWIACTFCISELNRASARALTKIKTSKTEWKIKEKKIKKRNETKSQFNSLMHISRSQEFKSLDIFILFFFFSFCYSSVDRRRVVESHKSLQKCTRFKNENRFLFPNRKWKTFIFEGMETETTKNRFLWKS